MVDHGTSMNLKLESWVNAWLVQLCMNILTLSVILYIVRSVRLALVQFRVETMSIKVYLTHIHIMLNKKDNFVAQGFIWSFTVATF